MKEDSWDKRRGEPDTGNFYEIHEQKANCCDSLYDQKEWRRYVPSSTLSIILREKNQNSRYVGIH